MWLQLLLLVFSDRLRAGAVRCFNGTFCFTRYPEDPLALRGLFWPSKRALARLHCSLTLECEVINWCVAAAWGLACYNCSATQAARPGCAGVFVSPGQKFNSTRKLLVNCTGENAMCFVRSWRARAHPAWIVQRGCYRSSPDDPLPSTLLEPTRAMSCKHTRLPDAEYKLCLCAADWCNSTSRLVALHGLYLIIVVVGVITEFAYCI